MLKRHRSTNGFSLVELAIGLAVLTVLILAISMSSGIRDNARVQSAANSVQALRAAAENYLATGKLDYSGLTFDELKKTKLLPGNFIETATNPWGGDFSIAANASSNTLYDIALAGLSKTDADKLSAYFNNSANALAFDDTKNVWSVTF